MGTLLKSRVLSREQARQKLEADIAEAQARYERRIRHLDELDAELAKLGGEAPALPVRAFRTLDHMLNFKKNRKGLFERTGDTVTPEAASKLSARELLDGYNVGHKTIDAIAAWLRFHGYELRP